MNAEIEFVEIEEGLQNEELLFSIGASGNLTTSRYIYSPHINAVPLNKFLNQPPTF